MRLFEAIFNLGFQDFWVMQYFKKEFPILSVCMMSCRGFELSFFFQKGSLYVKVSEDDNVYPFLGNM